MKKEALREKEEEKRRQEATKKDEDRQRIKREQREKNSNDLFQIEDDEEANLNRRVPKATAVASNAVRQPQKPVVQSRPQIGGPKPSAPRVQQVSANQAK